MCAGGCISAAIVLCVVAIRSLARNDQFSVCQLPARIAGLNPLRLMNDTTATALQYGLYRTKELPEKEEEAIKVLFVDHGYADTTATVVQFSKGKLSVLSAESDPMFGSRDIDQLLFDHFAAEFQTKYKIDVRTNAKATQRLLTAVDKTKKVISSTPEAPISVDCIMNDIDVRGKIDRAGFDKLLEENGVADTLMKPVNAALESAGLKPTDLFSVEISG